MRGPTSDQDPKTLLEALFEGLPEDEIASRIEHCAPTIEREAADLRELLSDEQPPLSWEEAIYRLAVPMLQAMLRAECQINHREAVADLADVLVERLGEAARHCTTRGEQRASIHFRHPYALSDAMDLAGGSPEEPRRISASEARNRMHPLSYLRWLADYEALRDQFKKLLPNKRGRMRKKNEISELLKGRYPELTPHLSHPADVIDLTTDKAARLVLGVRLGKDDKTISHLLAEARAVRNFRRSLAPKPLISQH
jgi:hypothetical protein